VTQTLILVQKVYGNEALNRSKFYIVYSIPRRIGAGRR